MRAATSVSGRQVVGQGGVANGAGKHRDERGEPSAREYLVVPLLGLRRQFTHSQGKAGNGIGRNGPVRSPGLPGTAAPSIDQETVNSLVVATKVYAGSQDNTVRAHGA
jgi:hypothetical protein